ncbi:Aldehyde-activating protein [Hyphomicrobiales bacterium]|nr:Aldehyde-activating protein [Hyphomicrobiales bacterium]CAH1701021.1 Aldehyde-activating protein [Hyphomicrobiales bacterium]CAI0344899.1 Aldehyde-activating protein [Hyphomicrobiales bacterium]
MTDEVIVQATCHCKSIRFEATLVDGLNTARRCDCSFCRMRGAVVVSASDVLIVSGAESLGEYQFNTKTAKHYFCLGCGIYTHHQRRSNPGELGVNVACIAGASPFDFRELQVKDGINHPSDMPAGLKPRIAGILRYEPTRE